MIIIIPFISSFEMNKVNPFPALTATFPITFLSSLFIVSEDLKLNCLVIQATLHEKVYFSKLGISWKAQKQPTKYHLSINLLANIRPHFLSYHGNSVNTKERPFFYQLTALKKISFHSQKSVMSIILFFLK